MRCKLRILIYIGLSLLLPLSFSTAQWNFYFDTRVSHEGNLLRIYRPVTDDIVSPQIGISYIGRNYEVFYSGELLQIVNQEQYSNNLHTAGIDFFNENNPIFKYAWGANLAVRFDQPEYSYYDFYQSVGYFNLRLDAADWTTIKTGLEISRKVFPEEDAWNHWETRVFYWQNFYLPTRSTLRLELNYLNRNFLESNLQPGEVDWTTGEIVDSNSSVRAELPTLSQLVGSVRWAQSFSPRLGGFTEFLYRYNTSRGNPYQIEQVSFSPIDDYFGYRGYNWTNSLKWKMTNQLWAKATFIQYQLSYINRPVYAYDFASEEWLTDTTGNLLEIAPMRKDNGNNLELTLGYKFENLLNRASDLEIALTLTFFNNRSNDAYFQYRDHSIGIKINYDLQW